MKKAIGPYIWCQWLVAIRGDAAASAAYPPDYGVNFFRIRDALVPPKPNELLMA